MVGGEDETGLPESAGVGHKRPYAHDSATLSTAAHEQGLRKAGRYDLDMLSL